MQTRNRKWDIAVVRLHDIMTLDVLTVSPETTLRDAAGLFDDEYFSGAPVVSGTKVVGVVSATDIVSFVASQPGVPTERPEMIEYGEWPEVEPWEQGTEPPGAFFAEYWSDAGAGVETRIESLEGPEWNVMEEHTVAEVMTRTVTALGRDATVREAAELMLKADIHRILVMEDDELVGLVTTTDLLKAVSQHGIAG